MFIGVHRRAHVRLFAVPRIVGHRHVDLLVSSGDTTQACAHFQLAVDAVYIRSYHSLCRLVPARNRDKIDGVMACKCQAQLNLTAFKAKYRHRFRVAVRCLQEDEAHLLTFYAFLSVMHRSIRTTNAIESFFSNVRQRTDQIDAFTTETSCLTIVWAVIQGIKLPKIPVR